MLFPGGDITREMAAGNGLLDLLVRYETQEFALELKIRRDRYTLPDQGKRGKEKRKKKEKGKGKEMSLVNCHWSDVMRQLMSTFIPSSDIGNQFQTETQCVLTVDSEASTG